MEVIHTNYGLSKSKEETQVEELLINPLPRAVLRPNTFVLLDGEWSFAIDKEDKGLEERWYLEHNYEHTGNWPGSIEEHMQKAKVDPTQQNWTEKIVAWYEREFAMPEIPNKNVAPFIIQLTFGACVYSPICGSSPSMV